MSNEIEGEKAWAMHKEIIKNEELRRALMLKSMELIHELHSTKLYKTILGDEEAPWSAYLGQHELFYTASKVYTMDRIYKKFIKELKLKPEEIADIPVTKLSRLIDLVNKINVDEWLQKARVLTFQDFQDELRKAVGKESYTTCPHKNEVDYKICQSCGYRHKV